MIYDVHVHIGRHMSPLKGGSGDAVTDLVERACSTASTVNASARWVTGATSSTPLLTRYERRTTTSSRRWRLIPITSSGSATVNPRHGSDAMAEIDRCVVRGGMAGSSCGLRARHRTHWSTRAGARRGAGGSVLQHAWNKAVVQLEHESTSADVARWGGGTPRATI